MRNKKFNRLSKKGNKELDVDITSLLDILVILLVFLLKSYNPSDLKLELVEGLTLPDSYSKKHGNRSIIIQVNKDHFVWIDDEKIGSLKGRDNALNKVQLKLAEIKKQDQKELDEFIQRNPASNLGKERISQKKANLRRVNIVLDQNLPYAAMQKIMHASATAGYPEFKFIVKGAHQ